MKAADYNKRELEQGRLTWEQLAVVCEYPNVSRLKTIVRGGALSWARITELVTTFQRKRALNADGMAGETTRARIKLPTAMTAAAAAAPVIVVPISNPNGTIWSPFDGPAVRQPRNRTEVVQMFGDPGTLTENKEWSKKNLIDCHERNGNRLPGVPAKWWISVHRVVEPYLREALRRILVSCPEFVIEVLGSHNWRPIRHKVGNPLSMHSWGLALDFNSHINKGIDFPKGKAPQLWTKEFYEHWPKDDPRTLTPAVLGCLRSCGFASGSDWDDDGLSTDQTYNDLMHVEWVARSKAAVPV